MRTVLDGKQWILELLLQGNIKSVISGGIYKDRRPTGADKEDIVINDISMDGRHFQDGVFNVNCYVPYLKVKLSGIDQYQPDHNRIKTIADAVYPLLYEVYKTEFNLTVTNHNVLEEDTEKANYINFRINLKIFN